MAFSLESEQWILNVIKAYIIHELSLVYGVEVFITVNLNNLV